MVDGRDVGQTPLREEVLLEPGKHVISVTKLGYAEATKELSAEGSKVELTLTLDKASATPATQPQASTPGLPLAQTSATTTSRPKGYRIGSYVAFGVGAAGIGVGTFFVLKAHSTQSDSDSNYSACNPHCSSVQKSSIVDSDQNAQHQRNAGAISYIIGGVGVATGVTLLLLDFKNTREQSAAVLRPWIGLGQAGVLGTF